MVFHGQIQTFVQHMIGEVVIAQSHITNVGSPLGAEENISEVHDQSEWSLSFVFDILMCGQMLAKAVGNEYCLPTPFALFIHFA